jgi:hypothetical protein
MRTEILDRFCIFGEKHLRDLSNEFVGRYCHFERPHQGIGNIPPMADEEPATETFTTGRVRCRKRLGGLLKSYYRSAACRTKFAGTDSMSSPWRRKPTVGFFRSDAINAIDSQEYGLRRGGVRLVGELGNARDATLAFASLSDEAATSRRPSIVSSSSAMNGNRSPWRFG